MEVIALIIGTVAVGQHCTLDAVCRCKSHFPAGQHAGVALVTDGVDSGTFFVVDVEEVKGVKKIVRIELLVDTPIYALTTHAQMPLLAVHVEVKSVKDGERGCCFCLKPGDVQRQKTWLVLIIQIRVIAGVGGNVVGEELVEIGIRIPCKNSITHPCCKGELFAKIANVQAVMVQIFTRIELGNR